MDFRGSHQLGNHGAGTGVACIREGSAMAQACGSNLTQRKGLCPTEREPNIRGLARLRRNKARCSAAERRKNVATAEGRGFERQTASGGGVSSDTKYSARRRFVCNSLQRIEWKVVKRISRGSGERIFRPLPRLMLPRIVGSTAF